MNFHKAKILLEKINRLYAGISEYPDDVNAIEKELMLKYLRDFYEIFYMDDNAPVKVAPAPKPRPQAPPITYTPPKPQPKPQPVVETPPPPKPVVKEVVVERVVEPAPKPQPKPQPVVVEVVKETPPPPKPQPKPKSKPVIDEDSEELFETKEATELSEKLGLSPIRDLSRAFGLNDRLMYTNELFGGNNNVYKETMEVLNSFNSFQQAKIYLIENVAGKYKWTSKKRKKKAKEFIKTVSRKYV